jgi:hypothetical protein
VDDGMMVYLNGAEVMRYNLPEGDIAYDTLAQMPNPISEPSILVTNISSANLAVGRNVLAVSVHNSSATSSDTVFGMQIFSARTEVVPPVLRAQISGNTIILSWEGSGFHLEQSNDPSAEAEWTDAPNGGASPATLPVVGFGQFFRLSNR